MGLIESRPTADYHCTQAELYAALDIIWNSQAEHENEFMAVNTKYTAGFHLIRETAINAAREMPDEQSRGAEVENLRLILLETHDLVISLWNSLDGYISKTFQGEHYKPRIEEAGKAYYKKAFVKNWEVVMSLLHSGKNFIDAHEAVLLSTGGMPANFVSDYTQAMKDFEKTYSAFKDAQQNAKIDTDKKILANNAIYKDGREMMEDGKRIFRKKAAIRNRFVWTRVMKLVKNPSPTLPKEKKDVSTATD